ncbi:transcription factor 20 [Engraulis encrasicolus]|uniref:transcription factor 20 n=1 Tax=Engraulis encrasicolus TaxID=184585 RepID=UPI002FCF9DC8
MQNFPNSPASLHPGFANRSGSMMSSPYPPHSGEPQISPRSIEEYAAMQQQAQANPQGHSQGHMLHRGQQHPGHAAHLQGYGSRNRATGEVPQSSPHGGASSNPYRKDMEYYFAAGGRDRSRRGGMGYGTAFGYSNMDGHIPHQYRHGVGSGSASGMMSPYPLDFASPAASGGGVGGGSGTGSFSPSQQYNMGQGPSMQSVAVSPMSQRQHSQKYPSHQAALHQGQPHRSYPLHSHRMPPQFSHYPSGSAGMYNSPPHRYDGSGAVDAVKVNSSPTHSNPPSSNSTGPPESMGQPYPAGHPQYSPQSHSLHKHAGSGQRNSQHSMAAGYDAVKMQPHAGQAGHPYSKHSQPPGPSPSPAMPHHTPQEVSKSPMNSQPQPAQMQQNFSPISNPSPAASAVQSPSCSSSSSPLMGVSEGSAHPSAPPVQPPPQSSLSHPRSSHGHGRLLQTVPQLSPTAHSNSSISSCGSSIGGKAGHPTVGVGRHGLTNKGSAAREDGPSSLYQSCPQEKVMADPGLNSLNALTSQVANLPNTVQHMMLTDSLLAHRKGKDGGQHPLAQPSSQVVPSPHSKGHGATGGDGGCSDRMGAEDLSTKPERAPEAKEEQAEHFSDGEAKRMRQMSGTSNESEANSYYSLSKSHGEQTNVQLQSPSDQSCRRLPLRVDTEVSKKQSSAQYSSVGGVHTKTPDAQTPSSSSPPSVPPSAQPSPNLPPCLPPSSIASSATPSPAHSSLSNCYFESDAANADTKNGVREREPTEIKMERPSKTEIDEVNRKWESVTHRGDLGVMTEGEASKMMQTIDNCKVEMLSPKQNENKDGRSDKGQNFLPDRSLNAAEPQHGGVGVIVSTRPDSNPSEMTKHPDNTPLSPQYGGPLLSNQQHFQDERKFLRDSRSHNGDGDGPVNQFPGQYDASSKPEFGQMPPHLAYKFGNHDASYNTCMSMKNRGRMTPTPGMAANPRFPGYNQPQPPFGSLPRKNPGIMGLDAQVRRAMGIGPRPEHNNSAMQQPYPSLLQEVLQGYHLDRRYGRPEQASAHLQSPNMAQHAYQARHPYGMIEGMKPHGVSSPAMMGGVNMLHAEMTPGKPHPLNQAQASGNEMGQAMPQPSWDPEVQRLKGPHGVPADKSRVGASPNQSSHMQQPTDLTAGTPPKHINLADYSLPQRKSSCLTSPPSAVQQLLLQDVEPLGGRTTPSSQTQLSTTSLLSPTSERRSVICDVSPSRRTPDQELGQFGSPAASVIQQTFSSPPPPEQDRKDQPGEKAEVKTEPLTSSEASSQCGEDLSTDAIKKKGKCTVSLVDIHSNHQRTTGGSIDLSATAQHHPHRIPHHSVQNPLMSPQRQQTCSQGLDVTGSPASAYAGYPYGDVREGNPDMSRMHNPAYHGYGMTSSQSQLGNKPEGYSHPLSHHHAHDANTKIDWRTNPNRPTEMMMPNSASEINAPQSQPEQKLMSPTDGLTNSAQLPRQQPPYPGAFYDMKMWEAFASRESGGGMLEGDPSTRVQQPASAAVPEPVPPQSAPGPAHPEVESPRVAVEDPAKPPHLVAAPNSVSNAASNASSTAGNQGTPQVRQFRTGSGEPNPLMMRRRVRSFISPIPAKRLHQDGTQKAGPSSYQSPVSHSDPRYQNDSDADLSRSRLPSPSPNSQSPPAQGKTKVLPQRKGRGLKLEAIVQKITPGGKKGGDYNSHGDSDSNYPDNEGPPYISDDPDIGARFASPYLGDGQSLDDVLTYRGLDDTGPPPITAYDSIKESSTGSSIGGALRGLQSDFDFGLGTSATPGSLVGEGDKDDLRMASEFTLLGPLPPAPPCPRPVQGSPPPSSSALSDIQQFTSTYQQLETRRGEQSAANLLRQKLQESGMGFDDYSSSDYYGTSPAHGQGHHALSRSQVSSPRSGMSMSDTKPSDNSVPKGYFPSGKKKGRPVGSVNKQKRAQQNQQQAGVPGSAVAGQLSPAVASAVAQAAPSAITKTEVSACPITMTEIQIPSTSTQPIQPAVVKVDVEGEEAPLEVAAKPGRHRQRKGKDDSEDGAVSCRQRRRRRAVPITSKEEPDTASIGATVGGLFPDKQNNGFFPYIHVERKIIELGAVCTIVNAEEENVKSGKGGSTDTLKNLAQMARRDKGTANVRESRVCEQDESGKALPSSEYVLPGPVVSETPHTGRLLCCLCQKWANYRHLGDLFGPFYPSDYASKLPKNHPQIKQVLSQPGTSAMGGNMMSNSAESTSSDTQTLDTSNVSILKSSTDSDCTVYHATYPTSPATTVGTASPAAFEEMPPSLYYRTASATINRKVHDWELTQESSTAVAELQKPPVLQNEVTGDPKPPSQHQPPDETQQWPQHRKLTSHPRFKRRHKSGENLPRTIPSNNKASLPFQPPPPSLDSLGPLAQLAQLPQMPLDPEELWVHEGCITWASGVFLVNGKLYGLQETLDGARETNCSHCEMVGATLGCHSKGCTLRYHYICGIEADCSMNEENFSLRCPKHKFSQSSRPTKSIYLEQSERG